MTRPSILSHQSNEHERISQQQSQQTDNLKHTLISSQRVDLDDPINPEAIHLHIFPCLPFGFDHVDDRKLSIDGWHAVMKPNAAGTITLVKDDALKFTLANEKLYSERVVDISCHAGKPESIGFTFPSLTEYIGTPLPIINIQLKHVNRFVSFTCEIADVTGRMRSFTATNAASTVRMGEDACQMLLELKEGWNKFSLDLASLTKKVFGVEYSHALRITVHSNCRLRRVYFSDRVYGNWQLPASLRLDPDNHIVPTSQAPDEKSAM